jgi:membrane-bound lytic murein transglycosylase D
MTREITDEFERSLGIEHPPSDIPLTVNNKVEYFVNYFQTSGRKGPPNGFPGRSGIFPR